MDLLTTNTKLLKGKRKYLVRGLAMAPHGISGHNVCSHSTAGCRSACNLWFAGRTVMPGVRDAMKRRKQMFLDDTVRFLEQLHRELDNLEAHAKRIGHKPLCRLNVASDLDWSSVIKAHPKILFFDYSKVLSRVKSNTISNYQITYSVNEKSDPAEVKKLLESGVNVAVVFNTPYNPQHGVFGKLPKTWLGHKVVDGDKHDYRLREIDGKGVVVGLRLKGGKKARANAIKSGFARSPDGA